MDDFETIIPFAPVDAADALWQEWLDTNDASALTEQDIMIDTGRGERAGKGCMVRRYRIRKDCLTSIRRMDES